MKTLVEIATLFRARIAKDGVEKRELAKRSGVSPKTLYQVLNGQAGYKVTTLLAVADRLGLEMVLLPKDAVNGPAQATVRDDIPVTLVRPAHARWPSLIDAAPLTDRQRLWLRTHIQEARLMQGLRHRSIAAV